ncbi:MAG: DNA recombination protein RmuC [Candidatus Margulisbacteria bacterium]|nr:DNA recombination protein RmuC [Candidatus Margulisiibacteriota bacterium]
MELLAITISVITLAAVGFLVFKLNQPTSTVQSDKAIELIQKQMEELRGTVTKVYSDNQNILQKVNTDFTQTIQNLDKNTNSRLDNAAKAIKDVYGRLGEVQQSTKQVNDVAKDIASLQEILRAPKIRGGMGELFLSDLLKQVLPPSRYKLQHHFKSREAVDAVILLKDGMVPVDSKFPLENFKKVIESKDESGKLNAKKQFIRDVKKHIDAIKQKYILPDEGTFDFALMYVPAENVYYEIIIKDENLDDGKSIFKYAIDNKVIPVSPNSFYGYLQTILLGLRGMRIEERAEEILKDLSRLEGDFSRVMDDFRKMGTHVKNMTSSYEATDKRLGKFGDKLESLENKQAVPQIES